MKKKLTCLMVLATSALLIGACSFTHKTDDNNSSQGGVVSVQVKGVSLNHDSFYISQGKYAKLSVILDPVDATNTSVTWTTSNSDIATVDEEGLIYGVSMGACIITVTTVDGGYSASCNLNVTAPKEDDSSSDTYDPDPTDESLYYISEAGSYDLTGTLEKQIVIKIPEDAADRDVVLNLNGVTISNNTNSPIYVISADNVEISAKKSTTNYIYDNRAAKTIDDTNQGKAAVYSSDGDLKFKGKGSLTIQGNYNNGIHGKDDVEVKNLTLNVTAYNHGIKGNDSVTIESGTVNVSCGGDGLKSENSSISSKGNQKGNVTLNGGTITVNSWGDAITAAYNAVIEELDAGTPLTYTAKTNKYSTYDGEVPETSDSKFYLRMNSTVYSGGGYKYAAYIDSSWVEFNYKEKQQGRNTYYIYQANRPTDATSFVLYRFEGNETLPSTTSYNAKSDTKAFNTSKDMITISSITNGTISLGSWTNYSQSQGGGPGGGPGSQGNTDKADSSAKGIKAENEIIIKSGTIDIKTYDDAIHTNNDGTLENGETPKGDLTIEGGSLTIDASDDGLHADSVLYLKGGTTNITNSYEGIEGNLIRIYEGSDTTILSTDDAVNACEGASTPDIYVYGGRLDVTVPSNGDTDGIDSNGTYHQSGGVVIVRGPGSASGYGGGGAFALDTLSIVSVTGGILIVFGGVEQTVSLSNTTKTIVSSNTVSVGNHTVSFSSSATTIDCYLKYSTNGCVVFSETSLGTPSLS